MLGEPSSAAPVTEIVELRTTAPTTTTMVRRMFDSSFFSSLFLAHNQHLVNLFYDCSIQQLSNIKRTVIIVAPLCDYIMIIAGASQSLRSQHAAELRAVHFPGDRWSLTGYLPCVFHRLQSPHSSPFLPKLIILFSFCFIIAYKLSLGSANANKEASPWINRAHSWN